MKILISGAGGLVGTALSAALTEKGDEVAPLTRHSSGKDKAIAWSPVEGTIEKEKLSGFDAAVHLAGENIFGRWTREKKRRIRESRIKGTKLLCEALAAQQQPPKALISASAIGYYGDRGDEELTEKSTPGTTFLCEVCREWEEATAVAAKNGIRVVLLRIGVVLSKKGGLLAMMLTPFRLGIGGKIGDGKQYLSWIALDDLVGIILYGLEKDDLYGPLNAVSPNPVTNLEFTKTVGKVLSRPTVLPVPAFATKLAFGEMANELPLASTRVVPKRLEELGFPFKHPQLEEALRAILNPTQSS